MPTLPLYNPAAAPGDWHDVTAPGGYECWSFDAEDASADTQVTVVFATGAPLHGRYLRAFAQYKRSPTRTLPPLPRDYAGVAVCVYRRGKLLRQSFDIGPFAASGGEVTIGPARLARSAETWQVSAGGVELAFTSVGLPPVTRAVLQFLRKSQHEWTAVAPRCSVAGTIGFGGERLAFAGAGSREYAFGTAPVCYGVSRVIRGRVFTGDGVVYFHHAQHPTDRRAHEALLLTITAAGVTETAGATLEPPYVQDIRFGETLALRNGRIIASHSRGLRMAFEADLQGTAGVAYADVIFPQPPRPPLKTVVMEWLLSRD